MNQKLHDFINSCLKKLGVRLVNARWGPRGVKNSLCRIKSQGFHPKQIVDIGASNGCWTKECMEIFPNTKYFLAEPQPAHRMELELFVRLHTNVTFWAGALGPNNATLPLVLHGGQTSFLKSSEYAGETIEVPVRKMDELVREKYLDYPDFIKADIQGYEVEALKGAEECMQKCQLLQLEVSYRRLYENCPLAHDVIEFVGQRGFRLYDISSYSQRPHDLELAQSDLIFARESSGLFSYEGWA